jgi:hypothetical protein
MEWLYGVSSNYHHSKKVKARTIGYALAPASSKAKRTTGIRND